MSGHPINADTAHSSGSRSRNTQEDAAFSAGSRYEFVRRRILKKWRRMVMTTGAGCFQFLHGISPRPSHHLQFLFTGKENEEIQFVLARRPRKRRESTGLSWDSLPDELLLGIFSCLPLQDLLRTSRVCKRWHRLVFDESLWHSVDLVGKAQVNMALQQVLTAGVLGLRCPRSLIGELRFANAQSLSKNPKMVRLNLCGCSGISPQSLSEMLQCCVSDSVHVTTDSFPVLQQLNSLNHLALSRCYQIHPAALIALEKFPKLKMLEVFGLVQDSYLPILSKGLPHIHINTCCFSSVARPTPAGRRDRAIWGMQCQLVFRP
ncbi:hypothetical protein JZ751_012176 [Albula glossodonta]|uniref:F-box domain-containing protein n=1 Tax=Albula glossodonta TaxID=121402 RepID=A0A8T2PRM5_9TELE|nr:hypothetical protein JZ751_012176 [Albula glossodonta]